MSDTAIIPETDANESKSILSKTIQRIRSINSRLDFLAPVGFLLLRCWVAWQFFKSGLTKTETGTFTLFGNEIAYPTSLLPTENTFSLFQEEYQVPVLPPTLAAYMGTMAELILPVLLMLGLAGRFSALGLFILNFMAVISYEYATLKDHLPWGLILLVFVLYGPGKLSLDYLIDKYFATRA